MKGSFYILTIFLGVVLTVHLAMNGKVGAAIGNPRVGNMVFWCIGAAGRHRHRPERMGVRARSTGLKAVNPLLLTAGSWARRWSSGSPGCSRRSARRMRRWRCCSVRSSSAMVLSHFGWLGSPVQPMTLRSVAGAAIMLVGVILATRK